MNTVAAKKILVVDDNADLLDILAQLLVLHGYDVSTADNGIDALHQVKAAHPDIILSDIQMPGMDGVTMRDELHAQSDTRHIPVLFFTGNPGATLNVQPRPLHKPVKIDELLARLSYTLQHQPL